MSVLAILFVQCKKANTPEQVTETFIKALQQNDFELAKSLSDSVALQTLEMIESFASQMGESIVKDTSLPTDVENIKCEDMQGTNMKKCYFTTQGSESYIELQKRGKEWKVVNFSKEGAEPSEEPLLEDIDLTDTTDTTIDTISIQ